jgi:pimeloyl-ACP methyl ester carboxylesterase
MSGNFVLIPGAGGVAWYWHRVESELRGRGHDVVAVDLPGDDPDAGLSDYVDIVVEAAGGRTDLVVVGQSLGGFSAVLACERLPVSLLVLVNAMIPDPAETAGDWWGNTRQAEAKAELDAREGRPVDAEFDEMTYFLHDVAPEVLADAEHHVREQAGKPFETPASFGRWPDLPTRVVVARDDRFFPAEFQRRVARERLGIDVDEVPGGHLVALSHPVELADLLDGYQREIAAAK